MGVVGLVIGPVLAKIMISYTGKDCPWGCKKLAALKRCCWIRVSLLLLWYASFSLCQRHLLENDPMKLMRCSRNATYRHSWSQNYKIWLLAQTLNFTFVPIQHRVGFVQIVAIFWNAYLSWMVNKSSPDAAALTVKDPLELVQWCGSQHLLYG